MVKKTHKVGRDAKNGRFITPAEAKRRPTTTIIERVPNAGYGDTREINKKGARLTSGTIRSSHTGKFIVQTRTIKTHPKTATVSRVAARKAARVVSKKRR